MKLRLKLYKTSNDIYKINILSQSIPQEQILNYEISDIIIKIYLHHKYLMKYCTI